MRSIPAKFLMPTGMLLVAGGLLLRHYKKLPDFADGLLFGIGIGLLLLAIFGQSRRKTA